MSGEHLTFAEMVEKYPKRWLFIVDHNNHPNPHLISGVVAAHSPTREGISEFSAKYRGNAAIRYTGRLGKLRLF